MTTISIITLVISMIATFGLGVVIGLLAAKHAMGKEED